MASDEELSDSQVESQGTAEEQSECKFIAERVEQYPEILEKSQLPTKKATKQAAIEKVVSEYRQLYGKDMTSKGLMKKVGNMKTRLKKKIDKNKTGNKRIPALLPWETIMMEAMQADVNPTVAQIAGKQIKVPNVLCVVQFRFHFAGGVDVGAPMQVIRDVTAQIPPKPAIKIVKRKAEASEDGVMAHESEETRKLSNSQLQRLVLLEQLKVARLQNEYFSAKLKNQSRPDPTVFHENGKTFTNL